MAAKVRMVSPVNTKIILNTILTAINAAVNDTADAAHEQALRDVPVRKVFKYGRTPRTNERIQGRQETRTLTVEEARSESNVRRRLGLASAFSGRQSVVQTVLFPGNYRSTNRANRGDDRGMERRVVSRPGTRENRLVDISQTYIRTSTGAMKAIEVPKITPGSLERESDLSSQGRWELKSGRAIQKGKSEEPDTLGGALRRTVQDGKHPSTVNRRLIKATISAGDEKVTYAKYVEFGTRRSRAQPFLRPALALARERLPEAMKEHLGRWGIWIR